MYRPGPRQLIAAAHLQGQPSIGEPPGSAWGALARVAGRARPGLPTGLAQI